MNRLFTRIANGIAMTMGQPLAFLIAASIVATWAITGPLNSHAKITLTASKKASGCPAVCAIAVAIRVNNRSIGLKTHID